MKPALRIALTYAVFSAGYILVSDWIVLLLSHNDSALMTRWQSLKGLAFIVGSAGIIFVLVLRYARERDAAQARLDEARSSFEMLFERTPLPIYVYDVDSLRFLAVNQAMVDEYGFPREEILQMTLADIRPQDDVEKLKLHLARIRPHSYTGQSRHLRKDGTLMDVEIISHPAQFQGHEARLAVAANITVRKIAERAMVEAFEARTEAERDKGRFLATISHEMRTPLNAITGFLTLFAGEKDADRRKEYLGIVEKSSDQLLGLVERFVQASELSSRAAKPHRSEVDLAEFLKGIAGELPQAARRRGIAFRVALDPALPERGQIDALRLEETLQILVGNAIKFSHGGTIELRADVERGEGVRAILKIAVSDEGIGIPPEQQARVFESFYQVDQSLTREYGGTGLGLFVARQLCDLMGAGISVTSELGKGSTFTVSLEGLVGSDGVFRSA